MEYILAVVSGLSLFWQHRFHRMTNARFDLMDFYIIHCEQKFPTAIMLGVSSHKNQNNHKLKNIFLCLFVLFIIFNSNWINAQTNLKNSSRFDNQELCNELILEINKYRASKEAVEISFQKYEKQLGKSTIEEIENCRCMDSLRIHLSKNVEKYRSDPKKKYYDNEGFNLIDKYSDKLEKIHFKNELQSNSKLQDFNDSLSYVLDRVNDKISGNRIYVLLNEEGKFLKNNVHKGYKQYLACFDKSKYSTRTKNSILVSLMFSNISELENEILNRIDKKENQELITRMIAVLNQLGTSKTAIHLIENYPNHNLTKPIADRFYRDKKTRCRDKRKIKQYLKINE